MYGREPSCPHMRKKYETAAIKVIYTYKVKIYWKVTLPQSRKPKPYPVKVIADTSSPKLVIHGIATTRPPDITIEIP